jgi:hypothetical protein
MSNNKSLLVKKAFRDKDSMKHHTVGSLYSADEDRLSFLVDKGFLERENAEESSNENFPKHTGGGYYELSNGEKVKGKEEALAAEEELSKEGE